MSAPAPAPGELRLLGLSRLEALELREALGPDAVRLRDRPPSDDEHRELGTTIAILVAIAPPAIRLVAELVKRWRGREPDSEIVVETERDGRVERRTIRIFRKPPDKEKKEEVDVERLVADLLAAATTSGAA